MFHCMYLEVSSTVKMFAREGACGIFHRCLNMTHIQRYFARCEKDNIQNHSPLVLLSSIVLLYAATAVIFASCVTWYYYNMARTVMSTMF